MVCQGLTVVYFIKREKIIIIINNDLDMHIQAKTNDRKVRRFGDILAPWSRETELKMRLRE